MAGLEHLKVSLGLVFVLHDLKFHLRVLRWLILRSVREVAVEVVFVNLLRSWHQTLHVDALPHFEGPGQRHRIRGAQISHFSELSAHLDGVFLFLQLGKLLFCNLLFFQPQFLL